MKRIYLSWSSDCNLEQSLPNIKKRIIGDCELIYAARLTSHDVDPTCLFPILKNCDAIFMLRGWEKEKKCLLEKIYAEYLGKEIYYEDDEVINRILSNVLSIFGISYEDFSSKNRHLNFVYARVLFSTACRKYGYTLKTIGNVIKRNHSTVLYYLYLYNEDATLSREFKSYKDKFEAIE